MSVHAFGSIGLFVVTWAFLLVLFFGDSSEFWPGFPCGIVAIAGSSAVVLWLRERRFTTWMLVLFYGLVDFILFMAFIAYMFYWRIYMYIPS
ncbi:MAG: hypothetical protein AAF802_29475 [Planctomycetota bacterium]